MDKQFVEVSGTRLAYLDTGGSGPTLLFVHGNSGSSANFKPQLESGLAAEFRLVALDLPGHGDSGRVPVTEYGLPFYARRLEGFATALDIADAILVGWSLGGHVVLEAADAMAEAPGFVIFGTPPLGTAEDMAEGFLPNPDFAAGMTGQLDEPQAAAYARSFLGNSGNPALEAEFVAEILATDPNARDGLGRSTSNPFVNEVELVARLERPLAIFHGAEERLVSLEFIRSLSMPSLWRGEVQVIEGAGHAPHLEQPEIFNRLLGEFAGQVSRS